MPALSADNNYFTAPNGGGLLLVAGDVISSSQTIYVFASIGNAGNCVDENEFVVTILEQPEVAILDDVTVCSSFILPEITAGNFFTESNGEGTLLSSGDEITATQTIYVFSSSDIGCSSESSFLVFINPILCNDLTIFPQFFTPNGDSFNDVWNVQGTSTDRNALVIIYDRFGKVLTQFNPATSNGWDGTYNGRLLPPSDYWFSYERFSDNTTLRGHFTLKL